MTTIETETKKTDFRNLELVLGGTVSIKGKDEVVIETTVTENYNGEKKLIRFGTLRRGDNEGITESRYSINRETGEEHLDYSGIYFGKENPDYHASERYPELNKILEEQKK